MRQFILLFTIFFVFISLFTLPAYGGVCTGTWTEDTFADFADGRFDGGGNVYAAANGKLKLTGQQWDLNNDGFTDIVFSNSRNQPDASSTHINSYIYWGSLTGYSIDNKAELPTHYAIVSSLADIDNDGFMDIIFSNHHSQYSYIYWGNGTSTFSGEKTELLTFSAVGNSVADLNNDGYLDIVFSNAYDSTYNTNSIIYYGIGNRMFTTDPRQSLPTQYGSGNSIADLNGDGFLDIVFSNSYDGNNWSLNSVIYWGSVYGFSGTNKTELPTQGAVDNTIADLNGDGFLDIIFCNSRYGTGLNVSYKSVIYWGSASGFSIDNKTELPTSFAFGCSVADLDGDGYLDIVFSNHRNDVSYDVDSIIYWGSASGFSINNKTEFPTHGATGNALIDLNGDGHLDIVFDNHEDGTPDNTSVNIDSYIFWGNGSRNFLFNNESLLPTHGAQLSVVKDLGDVYTRKPEFIYTSSPYDTGTVNLFDNISWVAETHPGSYVQFQIRSADTKEALTSALWYGPTGISDRYITTGTSINPIHSNNRWVQYRAFLCTDYKKVPVLDSVQITFQDTIPPVISSVSAIPNLLWPPNHKLATITVNVTATDNCSSTVTNKIVSVTSNEPDNGLGDGDAPNDIQNINGLTVQLRAERSGKGTGRIYTITVSSTDASGNTATKDVTVSVPKSQGAGLPVMAALGRNFPNPFNPETWIPYALAEASPVSIAIYDTKGQCIRKLDLGYQNAGYYLTRESAAYWDGKNESGEKVSSGIYFYTIQAGDFATTKKMVITK